MTWLRCIWTVLLLAIIASRAHSADPSKGDSHDPSADAPTSPRVVNDRCPVMVEEFASPQHEAQFRGYAVRFCCEKCQDKFVDDPVPYLSHLPQLPTATIQAAVAEAQQKAHDRHVAALVDRWTRPVLVTLIAVLAAWLAIRIVPRLRAAHPTSSPHAPVDLDEDFQGAHGPGGGGE